MRIVILLMFSSLLGACGTLVQTNISSFHQIENPIAGTTYYLAPLKEQEGSLEFKTYAQTLKAELNKKGMVEASPTEATYAVFMFYGIDNGQQVVSSYPIIGQTGSIGSFTTGTVNTFGNTSTFSGNTINTPTYGVVGTGTSTSTVYKRLLQISMFDIEKSADGKAHKIFEATAISTGSNNQLAPVLPTMLRSVFEEFPGKSGSSRLVIRAIK